MVEYILRDQAIRAVTGAKLPDVSESGLPIANGKRSVTDCVKRLKEIPTADVRQKRLGKWIERNPKNSGTCRLIECDQCGNSFIVPLYVPFEDWKASDNRSFCGCCGAYMREES